jgi:hypothetical protein
LLILNFGKIEHFRADQLKKILADKYKDQYIKQFNMYNIPEWGLNYELNGFNKMPEKHYNNLILDSLLVNKTNACPNHINILRINGKDAFLETAFRAIKITNDKSGIKRAIEYEMHKCF